MASRVLGSWLLVTVMPLACDLRLEDPPAQAQPAQTRTTAQRNDGVRRRALLVGINDYSASRLGPVPAGVPERDWWDLGGAVNDVESIGEMLELRYGFEPGEILTLTDQAATRVAILRAIETHLERPAGKGDIVFFYYAGHGSQVENSRSTEPDRLDESIVPADSRIGAPDIRDKELRRRFNRILDRGARLTVILDSCHSGSGARGLPSGARARAVRRDPRDVADGGSEGPKPDDRGALVISATQDHDRAHEKTDDDGKRRGVFTWAWLRAMRSSMDGESATDTFLRAQAILRGDTPYQEPVLSGNEEARLAPFLASRPGRRLRRAIIAVEKVRPDGTIVAQGGWAHGLTVGSELRLTNGDRETRFEVTVLRGLGRCEARPVPSDRARRIDVTAGALLEVSAWAAPPTAPLRVWMPETESSEAAIGWARELAGLARRRGVRWIDDPVDATPTHVVRWRAGAWQLLGPGGATETIANGADARSVLAKIPRGASLFTHLPAPAAVVKAIDVGPGTDRDAIVPVEDPQEAEYLLAGRVSRRGDVEYAWVRPSMTSADRSPLPARTAWRPTSGALAPALQDAVLRLRRIHGWQNLPSPSEPHPYELAMRRLRDGAVVRDRLLVGLDEYSLVLRAKKAARPPQYIYVFMIDSHGRSVLLFPLGGSVENRYPLASEKAPLAEIVLEGTFEVIEPYGVDTYFVLATDEPLPDPWVLEWDGVRGQRAAHSPLEELLTATGAPSRSAARVRTPSNWTIERATFTSAAPRRAKESS